MTENDVAWIICWVWLAFAFKLVLGHISKKSAEKKRAASKAEEKARRESRDDPRPTFREQVGIEADVAREYMIRGDNWALILNEIIARNELDNELGRFADAPIIQYHLEQDERDNLLAFARRDAAEAVLNTRTLLTEVHELRKSYNELVGQFFWLGTAFLLWTWWKSGFALWEWVKWWNWFK